MSLRRRLFVTYLLLLFVTLGVIVGSMLLFFSAKAEPPRTTYENLQLTARLMQHDLPTVNERLTFSRLQELADSYETRIIVLGSNQVVRFDSAGYLNDGTEISLYRDNQYLVNLGRVMLPAAAFFGNFRDPSSDQEWLILSLQTQLNNISLIICELPSTRSLSAALAEFSSSIAAPLLQSGVIGLIFAFILAAFMSRQIAKPLGAVARAASSVARGDYEAKLPETGALEVRSVAEAFNTMTREVRSTQQAQRDFLANVSHDLKTPLTSIQGYSQAIMDGAVREPASAAEVIFSEADRLARMVNELTTLASLQSGRVALHLDQVDIIALTKALIQRIAVVADNKNVALSVRGPQSMMLALDGDRMAQVITNLLSNAVKFTPEGGHIQVTMRELDHGIEIAIRDSGIGIPHDELTRVFERFYQVDKARGPQRGTGLGLAIAKEIVMAHGGKIHAESAGEGRGATFVIWLPVTPPLRTGVSRVS